METGAVGIKLCQTHDDSRADLPEKLLGSSALTPLGAQVEVNGGIVASGVGRMFPGLIAVFVIRTLIVDLDDNGRPQRLAVAWVLIALRLKMPAGTTGTSGTVDVGDVALAVDRAVGVVEGKCVDGCCADAFFGSGAGPAGYVVTAFVVPGEGSLVDGQATFEERIRRADRGRGCPEGSQERDSHEDRGIHRW